MQITIETQDNEELKNALNNAIILYHDLIGRIHLVGISEEFIMPEFAKMLYERFGDDEDSALQFLRIRLNLLKELYNQL